MAIPPTSKEAINAALDEFDRDVRSRMGDWEANRNYEHALVYNGRRYPPKQIISMAAKVPTSTFSGGPQANSYLESYGFQIVGVRGDAAMAVNADRWADFIAWARRFYERADFFENEVDYKLIVAEHLLQARQAVASGASDWLQRLRAAFGPPNNLTPWQVHDSFLKWVAANSEAGRACLNAAWDESKSAVDRVDGFLTGLPVDVVTGAGQRLALASFLQAAVDPHLYPVYRPEAVRAAYRLVRYEAEADGATGGLWYQHFLSFLDAIIAEATKRGLQIPDRLGAQGVLWSVVHTQAPTDWTATDQRALIMFRGGPVSEGDEFRDSLLEILSGYSRARRSAPFGGENEVVGAFKRATQGLQASGTVRQFPHIRVSYSAGQGNWAKVPWIALMDDRVTRSTQRGLYCVYLFCEDLSGVYLTLNQGVTDPKRQLGPKAGRESLRDTVAHLRQRIGGELAKAGFAIDDGIDLQTSSTLGSDYEASTIAYKLYAVSSIPSSVQLVQDLEQMLGIYETKVVAGDQPEVDLAVVASQFSAALIAANVDYGHRHDELVRTFLSSVMTRPLVVLTGLSGSGKSQLAAKLGEWLGEAQRLFVPVRPDWTGPEALFGYVDILQPAAQDGRRIWSVPDVLAFLLRAAMDAARPYVLILDEMNLAHVERYFADFLSGMESGEPVLPNIVLEGGTWRDALDDANPLPIPRNLFVVGTVNVDETTYMFSPKVLDRANVLEFRVATEDLGNPKKPEAVAPAADMSAKALLSVVTNDSWQEEHPAEDLDSFTSALRALHTRLSRHSSEFGFRTFYDARRYLAIYSAMGGGTWVDALDLQATQKILPRLHGARRRLEGVLLELAAFCMDVSIDAAAAGTTVDPLGDVAGQPQLPRTWHKVKRMLASARANQFASFLE